MKLLILGGSRFLGKHLVEAALARNFEVTLFNRGISGGRPEPNVETLHGDRNTDLNILLGRQWDCVVDTSGYWPSQVRSAALILSDNIRHYTFISTCSVYRDFTARNISETDDVLTLEPEQLSKLDVSHADRSLQLEHYGALKYHCEEVLQQDMPARSLIVRPGLIVGPYDVSDRFAYWVRRLMRGGNVLAPGSSNRPIQLIDGRDLAEWVLALCTASATGTFNAAGPKSLLTMGELLQTCRDICGTEAEFTWVSDDFLQEQKIQPWTELPFWLPEREPGTTGDLGGIFSLSIKRAVEKGLSFRPLHETVRDTMHWLIEAGPKVLNSLKEERELELLKHWESRLTP
ncbi:NAD-dependent epimerase/dehydratase family protein [Paenibacillus sp. CAU 1782]